MEVPLTHGSGRKIQRDDSLGERGAKHFLSRDKARD